MTAGGWLAGLLLVLTPLAAAAAESPKCRQARDYVEKAKADLADELIPGPKEFLARLDLPRSLCPALGETWRLSYCAAQASGDGAAVARYRERALMNGMRGLTCPEWGTDLRLESKLGLVREKFALLIGIGKFKDANVPTLRYPAKDAHDLRDTLVNSAFFRPNNVVVLTDTQATRENILNELQKLALRVQPDDLMLLFVSTHGAPSKVDEGLLAGGFVITHDAEASRAYVDGLRFADLRDNFALLKARRKVVFLDTCYSGETLKKGTKDLAVSRRGVGSDVAGLFLSTEGTFIVTSSKATETSFESDKLQNGYFTHFLVKALRTRESKTLGVIFKEVRDHVQDAVAQDLGESQTPEIFPLKDPGDLKIAVTPTSMLEEVTGDQGAPPR